MPRYDRRLWLEWNDREQHAQSLIDRMPCTGGVGARCMLFEGHGGVHWYAPTNGYLTSAGTGRRRAEESDPQTRSNVVTVDHADDNGHREGGHHDLHESYGDVAPTAPSRAHDVIETGAHRESDHEHDLGDIADTHGVADIAEIPNLRGRAVRGQPPTDRLDAFPSARADEITAAEHPSAPSVSAALDAVVAALAQLAEALRRSENER
ncbi:hypothetical protein [Williamsia maris]|uniref:hypothetical protein n=1 Tax=Williamsia maris TaxID=72806 RepID=UPI0020A2AB24|nr:hypothetical protein [Williamsia maris]